MYYNKAACRVRYITRELDLGRPNKRTQRKIITIFTQLTTFRELKMSPKPDQRVEI